MNETATIHEGTVGKAHYTVTTAAGGQMTVQVYRDYETGVPPSTAQRVWEVVSDFGGIKTIFPSVLRIYLTYPDDTDTALLTVRNMTFAGDPLSIGIEQLVHLDEQARELAYTSVLGLPVTGYRSVMAVTGDDACRLTWTSTFTPDPGQEGIADVLANILAAGANQIATALGQHAA